MTSANARNDSIELLCNHCGQTFSAFLHQMADKAGRDRRTLSTSVFRAPADKAALKEYEAAGIDRAVLEIPDQSRDEILRVLDSYAPLLG